MKIRIVLLVLAIVFGIAAVFGVMIYLNNIRASVEKETETIGVLVVIEDIAKETPVDSIITKNLVEVTQVPKKYVVEGALSTLEKYKDHVVKDIITKGEQITPSKLIRLEDIRVSFTVPEGMVAVSIPFDEVRAVSNFIKPNDRVNVIATFEPSSENLVVLNKQILAQIVFEAEQEQVSEGSAESPGTPPTDFGFPTSFDLDESDYIIFPVTKVLLWNVEVLYVGFQYADSSTSEQENENLITQEKASDIKEIIRTVTLALTPEQSEKLIFAQELGKAWLSLVPAGGIEEQDTPGRTYLNIMESE
jgi:Flp pilus assembly protein CpaB